MATQNNINIGVNVSDNGTTAKVNKEAEKLKSTLDAAAKSAGNINTGGTTARGGTAGSRNVADTAATPPRGARSSMAPTGSAAVMSDTQYNAARGMAGETGASARDFAKQARELDGLVRLYAIYAAHVYAVGAAFRALSDAANTDNLIKGLDSLGASSGKNLTFLSKQLVAATDGAISLKEAMTTVATASSAGMNSAQIKDIAVVASKASQALGVNMADALSRLSRGITKIEPELLDELGIFVKVDEATSKYALSVSKSAASLSDFEKRQAFANAVVAEGKKKFEELETVTNPYDKLMASVTNLSTEGLSLINKVLGPIVSLLSESPTALLAIFAAVGTSLVKQAIPALGAWRDALAKSAESSAKSAERIRHTFMEYSIDRDIAESAKLIKPSQEKVARSLAEGQDLLEKTLSKRSKILANAMVPNVDASAMVASLDKEISRRNAALDIASAKRDAEYVKGAQANKTILDQLDRKVAKGHEEISNIQEARNLYAGVTKELAEQQKLITKFDERKIKPVSFDRGFKDTGEWMRQQISNAAQAAATSRGILAQTGSDTATKGTIAAFKNLFDSIKNGRPQVDEFGDAIKSADGKIQRMGSGLTGLPAILTKITGSLLIAGSAIGTFMSAIQPILIVVELLVAAYGVFDSVASKAAKQQEAFNTATQGVEGAIKTAKDTLVLYTEKKKEAFNIAAISAYTNAISGISDALHDQMSAFQEYKKAAGVWDDIKDSIASAFGKGNLDKLQKGAVESLKSAMDMLDYSSNSGSAKTSLIASIFGDKAQFKDLNANTKELNKAFDGLTSSEREAKIKKIADAIDNVRKAEEYSTNAAKAFIESLSAVDKLVDQMIQANAFTDLQGKLGVELVNAAQKLAQALSDPLKVLTDLAALGRDPKALASLGIDTKQLEQAVRLEKQLNDLTTQRKQAKDEEERAKAGKGELATKYREADSGSFGDLGGTGAASARALAGAKQQDIKNAQNALDTLSTKLKEAQKLAAEYASNQIGLVTQIAEAGFERIQLGLKRAKEQAQIGVERTAMGIAASAGANTAQKEYDLKIRELDIQKSLIEANYKVQLATIKNTQELEKFTLTMQEIEVARLKSSKDENERAAGARLDTGIQERKKIIEASESGMSEADINKYLGSKIARAAVARRNEPEVAKLQAQAATAGVEGQARSAALEKEAKQNEEKLRNQQAVNALKMQELNTSQELVKLANQLGVAASDSLLDLDAENQKKLIAIEASNKQKEIQTKIKNLEVAGVREGSAEWARLVETKEGANDGLYKQTLKQIEAEKVVKQFAIDVNNINNKANAEIARRNKQYEVGAETKRLENSLTLAQLDQEQKLLDIRLQLGTVDAAYAISRKAEMDTLRETIRYEEERAKLLNDMANKATLLEAAKQAVTKAEEAAKDKPAGSPEAGVLAQARESQTTAETIYNNASTAVANAKTLSDMTKQNIADTAAMNTELERQKQLFDSIGKVTESLSAVFGTLGESVGKFAETLTKAGVQSEANAKSILDNADKQKELTDIQLNGGKLTEEQETRLKNLKKDGAALAKKSAKDELNNNIALVSSAKKMFGEKTAAHKALAAVEKVLHIQRIAMDMKELFIKLFTDKAETASKIESEVEQTAATEAGFLARTVTYISEIFAKFTATMGPWGWAAAAAVVAAIFGGKGGSGGAFVPTSEQRQKTQGTAMSYDNTGNLVQTSRGVFGDTEAKSESITKSLELIAATTVEGLSYDNRVVSLLSSINEGITGSAKSLYRISGLRTGSMFGTVEGNSGGGIFSGSLGGSTSTSINDAGIIVKGTFAQLASDTNAAVLNLFEEVTKSKKSWYGKSSTWVDTNVKEIDSSISNFFSDIFSNARDLFIEVGKSANIGQQAIDAVLSTVSFDEKYSLRDLKGAELEKEMNNIVSSMLDTASEAIFKSFEDYAKFGEGMLETVIRVTDTNTKIAQSIRNIGSVYSEGLLGNFEATEKLVGKFKDLQDYLDKATYFADNFLTDAERLAPTQKALAEGMDKLGLSGIRTRGQFANVVRSLDLTTVAGRETYTKLLELAPAFIKVADAAGEIVGSLDNIYDITTRLGKANKQYLDVLKTQSSTLSSTIDNLKSFIKSIGDFKAGLLLSNLSPLTPEQRYAEAKTQYETTLAKAKTGDKDAMSKLQNAAEKFLTESQSFYASSTGYQSDFSAVQQALTDSASSAQDLLTDAEKQLSALNSQIDLLEESSKTLTSIEGYLKEIGAILSGGFNTLDTNTDGILTYAELKASGIASDSEIKNMISLLDKNGDGQISLLEAIAGATGDSAKALLQFNTLIEGLQAGKLSGGDVSAALKGTIPAETGIVLGNDLGAYVSSGGAVAVNDMLYGKQAGQVISIAQAQADIQTALDQGSPISAYNAAIAWGISSTSLDRLMSWKSGTSLAWAKSQGLPEFAIGTNLVPEDMPAIVHKGERIIPAADNTELLGYLNNKDSTNQALLEEIKQLNQRVASLEATIREGDLLNARATERNTQEVVKAVGDSSSQSNYIETIRGRASVR